MPCFCAASRVLLCPGYSVVRAAGAKRSSDLRDHDYYRPCFAAELALSDSVALHHSHRTLYFPLTPSCRLADAWQRAFSRMASQSSRSVLLRRQQLWMSERRGDLSLDQQRVFKWYCAPCLLDEMECRCHVSLLLGANSEFIGGSPPKPSDL